MQPLQPVDLGFQISLLVGYGLVRHGLEIFKALGTMEKVCEFFKLEAQLLSAPDELQHLNALLAVDSIFTFAPGRGEQTYSFVMPNAFYRAAGELRCLAYIHLNSLSRAIGLAKGLGESGGIYSHTHVMAKTIARAMRRVTFNHSGGGHCPGPLEPAVSQGRAGA